MEYYNKIGLKKLPLVFLNGYPLKESEIEADSFEESVISKIMHLTQDIQMAYYHVIINRKTRQKKTGFN